MNNTFKYSCSNKNIDSIFTPYHLSETSVRVHHNLNWQPYGRKVLPVKQDLGVVIFVTIEWWKYYLLSLFETSLRMLHHWIVTKIIMPSLGWCCHTFPQQWINTQQPGNHGKRYPLYGQCQGYIVKANRELVSEPQSCVMVKYGHEAHGTCNQEWLCWQQFTQLTNWSVRGRSWQLAVLSYIVNRQ